MEIEFFRTSIGSPIVIALTIVYFLCASITTFDIRITQAKHTGHLDESYEVPAWTGLFAILMWLTFVGLLLLNPIYAVILFVIKFILKVIPVLENIGAVLMIPVLGTTTISAVNINARMQREGRRELNKMVDEWKDKGSKS